MMLFLLLTVWVPFFLGLTWFTFENIKGRELLTTRPTFLKLSKENPVVLLFPKFVAEIDSLRERLGLKRLDEKTSSVIKLVNPDYHLEPELFDSVVIAESILVGLVFGIVFAFGLSNLFVFPITTVLVSLVYGFTRHFLFNDIHQSRTAKIRLQLPYATEILGMVMEAGGNINNGMESVIKELKGTPISEEFNVILREWQAGKSRIDAFRDFQAKFQDPDITEFVFALTKGEEMGTPMAKILFDQSRIMRLKLSQWCEKAAAEATMQIVFPGLLIMLASLICLCGPFLLPLLYATEENNPWR